jgi:hypothetical protein
MEGKCQVRKQGEVGGLLLLTVGLGMGSNKQRLSSLKVSSNEYKSVTSSTYPKLGS